MPLAVVMSRVQYQTAHLSLSLLLNASTLWGVPLCRSSDIEMLTVFDSLGSTMSVEDVRHAHRRSHTVVVNASFVGVKSAHLCQRRLVGILFALCPAI